MPAHPKLRSSCDGCGTAKVKCDRTQPECGRCASHSMPCVYGVSRKMGKPPREKMRLKTSAVKLGHDGLYGAGPPPLGPGKMLDSVYGSMYHGHNVSLHPGMNGHDFVDPHYHPGHHHDLVPGLNCGGPKSNMDDVLAAGEPLEHHQHHWHHHGGGGGFLVNMEALDPLYGDYVDPAPPLFVAHDFAGDWSLQPDAAVATGTNGGGYLGNQPNMAAFGPLSTPESPEMSSDSSKRPAQPTMPPPAWSSSSSSSGGGSSSSSNSTTAATTRPDSVASSSDSHHDCAREAHDILESLSPARLGSMFSVAAAAAAAAPWDATATMTMPIPTPTTTTMTTTTTTMASAAGPTGDFVVPLDAILQLNREASGRLGRLLACGAGCARAPALVLLYASIVARVLAWYQQAAASCCAAAWNAGCQGGGPPVQDTPHTTTANADAGAAMVGTPWDSTIVVADGGITVLSPGDTTTTTTMTNTSVPGAGGDPHHVMALGAFSIDDLRIQGALKTQLLAGEMRRAARLIDRFAAFSASASTSASSLSSVAADGLSSFSSSTTTTTTSSSAAASPASPPVVVAFHGAGGDTLCLGLEAWLRGEYARIDSLLRDQLRELSY